MQSWFFFLSKWENGFVSGDGTNHLARVLATMKCLTSWFVILEASVASHYDASFTLVVKIRSTKRTRRENIRWTKSCDVIITFCVYSLHHKHLKRWSATPTTSFVETRLYVARDHVTIFIPCCVSYSLGVCQIIMHFFSTVELLICVRCGKFNFVIVEYRLKRFYHSCRHDDII